MDRCSLQCMDRAASLQHHPIPATNNTHKHNTYSHTSVYHGASTHINTPRCTCHSVHLTKVRASHCMYICMYQAPPHCPLPHSGPPHSHSTLAPQRLLAPRGSCIVQGGPLGERVNSIWVCPKHTDQDLQRKCERESLSPEARAHTAWYTTCVHLL